MDQIKDCPGRAQVSLIYGCCTEAERRLLHNAALEVYRYRMRRVREAIFTMERLSPNLPAGR